MVHRGPDGYGDYLDARVGLTMRRLAIIDLQKGSQPLYNEDKSIVIVGNGEIYNYKELRGKLFSKGHELKSESDIEIIAHLYEDEGLKCLRKLRGMFALAIYDKGKNQLHLVRDRLGEKPLYWSVTKHGLIFASEMKALLATNKVSRDLNYPAIDKYFHYFYVPEPETLIRDVQKLMPGWVLSVDLETMKLRARKYWNAEKIKTVKKNMPIIPIRRELERACKMTTVADVPIGISLSGGLDSGAVLALVVKNYKNRLVAFSVGYEGTPKSDERHLAKKLADFYGVRFVESEIKVMDVVKHFPKLVYQMDDPIADIAAHSIYMVSQLARNNKVPVLLGGIGGDELFWGYQWVSRAAMTNLRESSSNNFHFYELNFGFRMADWVLRRLYTEKFSRAVSMADRPTEKKFKLRNKIAMGRKCLAEIRDCWLLSDVIALGDRMSMAASIELRSPFLDYKLVETVLANVMTVEAFDKPAKHWLKEALRGVLPDAVLDRPKRGFTPPIASWIKAIIDAYSYLLDDGLLISQGVISEKSLFWIRVGGCIPLFWYQYYQLILMEIWLRENIGGQKVRSIRPKSELA